MNDSWKTNKVLENVDPKKLQIMELLITQCQGKNISEILPNIMTASSRMSEQGLSFTNTETTIILDALKEGMTPEERQRLDMLRGVIM